MKGGQDRRTSIFSGPAGHSGFTLVELLVVIAIISILAGLLMPALEGAIAAAHDAQCLHHQREVNLAALLCASDHDGILPWGDPGSMQSDGSGGSQRFPESAHRNAWMWLGDGGYLLTPDLFTCPRAPAGGEPISWTPTKYCKTLQHKGGDFQQQCKDYIDNGTDFNQWWNGSYAGVILRINRPWHDGSGWTTGYYLPTTWSGAYYAKWPISGLTDGTEPFRRRRRAFVEKRWPFRMGGSTGAETIPASKVVLTTCVNRVFAGRFVAYHNDDGYNTVTNRYPTSRLDGSGAMTYWNRSTVGGWGYPVVFQTWDANFMGNNPWNE